VRKTQTVNDAEFLATYDPRQYPPVAVTVDVVAFTIRDAALRVLLVRRDQPPGEGMRALPGGFVGEWEDLPTAAARQVAEKTGVTTAHRRLHMEQLSTYGAPDRDPRMRIVSVAYIAFAPDLPDPAREGSMWTPVHDADGLAFDHSTILRDGLARVRSKLEYTPLATKFVGAEFTIAELRAVYEIVWGEPLHAGNFHRKVLSVPGFVESTGQMTERGGARGGPRAKLYRAGDARLLHPPLLMPSREEAVR
jgi:8-oxo-dGTP diphosphatase